MLSFYAMGIANALIKVKDRINNSAVKAGRNPDEIKLVAVSKTVELQRIIEAIKAGAAILGENRAQEAREKISDFKAQIPPPVPPPGKDGTIWKVEWHLIGNLQKNKAATAVRLFDLIHTVDTAGLAEELDRRAHKIDKIQRVLIQVKLSDETAKHGIPEKDLMELLEKVTNMDNLRLEGFMTMPPFFEDPEKTRPYFRRLKELADKVTGKGFTVNELSMGMSNDFEVAIEEGATMVRVGSAIFGERNY
jgi:pyridoxal phosphate enzyme (YggS family)